MAVAAVMVEMTGEGEDRGVEGGGRWGTPGNVGHGASSAPRSAECFPRPGGDVGG